MNLLVSNKIVCSMGLFEGPGNEGEELHQMFAICDEIIKILPTWDFVFKNSNEKLDKRLIKIWNNVCSKKQEKVQQNDEMAKKSTTTIRDHSNIT